jgi:integrase
MAKRQNGRVYWRERGGVARAYADFRDFRDVGGGREALIAPGEKVATDDSDVADKLVADRLKVLHESRRNRTLLGVEGQASLSEYASHHLVEKARAGRVTRAWLDETEKRLEVAVEFFGADRELSSITVRDLQQYMSRLRKRPGRNGNKGLSSGTVRHYLNALSNLFQRAQSEQFVPPGFNPVAALVEKPVADRQEARWLEVNEAALFLEAARLFKPKRGDVAIHGLYPLIGTFLLTGGRKSEVLGLEMADVSFERRTVTFRPNEWRRLKTRTSHRTVPLWPQLEEILQDYLEGPRAPQGSLIFPSSRTSEESLITDTRRALDAAGETAGWDSGEIRTKIFRHSYCAARLQTLDGGHPVAQWTVGREMGHGGTQLVERVYGHLGDVRHRSEVVEYRVEQHEESIGDRLKALRKGSS